MKKIGTTLAKHEMRSTKCEMYAEYFSFRISDFGFRYSRKGYIFLISVLFVSAVAVSVLGSYLLLSIASLENGVTFQASNQALENAQTCAERGLMSLFLDSGYTGNETVSLSNGSCEILTPGGFGNDNRTLCVEGLSGAHTRRVEIVLERLLPSIQVYSWAEVATITSCSY